MFKLGTQTGSLINHVISRATPITPEVGMGATILQWSDRTACTIIEVSPKKIVVQDDIATRTDSYGMSDCQSYDYTPNPEGAKSTYTLRKNGKWIREGDSIKGQQVAIGERDHYYDYSF